MLKLNAVIFVEPNDPEQDPEELVTNFNGGFGEVLSGFPDGELVLAKVETAEIPSQSELEERGLVE